MNDLNNSKDVFPESLTRGEYLPPVLSFGMSNVCNACCIMCDHAQEIKRTGQRNELRELTIEELSKMLEGVELIRSAILSGSHSEPLLNKDFAKIVYMLKNRKNAAVQVFTNGILLNRHMIEKIIYSGLDILRISLHGATKETAERTMENASFPRIISNIRETVRLKKELSSKTPLIEIAFVGMKQNIAEFSDLVALAAELGVEHVSLNSLQERQEEGLADMKGQSIVYYPELLRKEYEQALAVAKEHKIQLTVNDPYRTIIAGSENNSRATEEINQPMVKGKTRYCLFPFEKPFLDFNGVVSLCCSAKGRYVRMGNAGSEGFSSVWNSDTYIKIRRALLTGENLPSYCYECERASVVDPFVMQMDITLRQLYWFPNEEFRSFIRTNKSLYPAYVKAMQELGALLVPYEIIDDLSKYDPVKKMEKELQKTQEKNQRIQKSIQDIKNSLSWKITAPLRWVGRFALYSLKNKRDVSASVLRKNRGVNKGSGPLTDDFDMAAQKRRRMREFKDRYKGQKCFVIGNGPSLNKVDLRLLANEYTFGVNGIFYKYDEMGFKPTFYTVEDNHVVADNLERINAIDYSIKFFPHTYHKEINHDDNTIFFNADMGFYRGSHPFYCKPRFSSDCSDIIYAGQTVTYVNLQLAFYMGFEKVYLIGMDFSYTIPKSGSIKGLTIVSNEDDPNHFHPDYFGKGKKWHFPKLENCKKVYEHASKIFEENGRKIYNATVGGKLEVFERVDFYSLFPGGKTRNKTNYLKDEYWKSKKFQNFRQAITLETKNSNNIREFHLYGMRLLGVMLQRFIKHGEKNLAFAEILEIGCGIGRYTLPLACRFQHVHAVDISKEVINEARKYCSSVPNVSFYVNDGYTLNEFQDESMEYVLSTGVFQHIPKFEVITGYIRDAVRIMKPNGLFLFTFQVWQTEPVGKKRVGAKITATGLDESLRDEPYEIIELSTDPIDPIPHFLALIRKTHDATSANKSFKKFPLKETSYRTGIFDDLKSCSDMVEQWKKPQRKITFYDS